MFRSLEHLARRGAGFWRRDDGMATLEVILFVPLMLTIVAATFSLHDAFRQKTLNIKAAHTISDALSRQTDPVDGAYMDGMIDLLSFLTRSAGPYSLRVTSVRYDASEDRYDVDWSATRGGFERLEGDGLAAFRAQLPTMLHNERVIVVETVTHYSPLFQVEALPSQDFYNFVATRPRFAPKLVWAGV